MKAFHTIAIPHRDILEGRLTMDVFAADLWEVSQNRGPDEYKDADTFFRKTYLTQGLDNLLSVVKKRLRGEGGDPVIQIQTPFGGGKTHALIAMYHKAAEWNASKVVVAGTALGTEETLWGLMERQLTGEITKLSGRATPGKEAIRGLLYENQPVLILMDEVLEYVTKAAGVTVADSSLAAQAIAFMQELTETVSTLEKVCVAVTLPASIVEHYDERAEILFQQLQKVAGRIEKIYTPVQESEITKIIRRRLFGYVDEGGVKKNVAEFMEYAEREGILPPGLQPSEYRDRFVDSYPFMPEVVDVLYHRWGSFPTFQRTRGVLRLLSLLIHSLKEANRPYIGLADFDLADQDIRQELLKHIGPEYNSVIGSDITDVEAGSKKVDVSLGRSYQGLSLGSRAATTIFLHSFSGGQERGSTLGEIKRCATTTENLSSVVVEATTQLKGKLFYLQDSGDRYFFSNQPNLNRILLTNMENIEEPGLDEEELGLIKEGIKGGNLKVFVWQENAGDIPDSEDLKLVILKREDKKVIQNILRNKGQTPRVYRNTLFFLYPLESERPGFMSALKRRIAYERIEGGKNLSLSDDQKREVRNELKKATDNLKESIRRLYRMIAIPDKGGFKEADLGVPTYGEKAGLDQAVYERLRSDGEILERIAPLVIKEKYLSGKEYVLTEQLYQSALKTPGEPRPANKQALEQGITEGVNRKLFGLGELRDDQPKYIRESTQAELYGNEILVDESLMIGDGVPPPVTNVRANPGDGQITIEWDESQGAKSYNIYWSTESGVSKTSGTKIPKVTSPHILRDLDNGKTYYLAVAAENDSGESSESSVESATPSAIGGKDILDKVHLKFRIPKGKVSGVMGMMNLLHSKFESLEIEINAARGEMSKQDYEDKIEETLRQLEIDF